MSGSDLRNRAVSGVRVWLGLAGVLAVVTGILLLWKPGGSVAVFTTILAAYAVVAGVLYLAAGIFAKGLSGLARFGQILVGLIFIAAGVVTFMNPLTSGVLLSMIVVVFIAIAWIFEGVAALTTLSVSPAKGWTVFFAIVSILGGIALLFAPLTGVAVLLIWLAVSLIVIGVFAVIRAFQIGR